MCTFFIMSGYLCAIRPLQLIRAGKPDEARAMIAGKALRRYLCLGIPASMATTISWFMTNVGAFRFSKMMPGNVWLNFHSAWESPTWGMAFRSLWHAIVKRRYCLRLADW